MERREALKRITGAFTLPWSHRSFGCAPRSHPSQTRSRAGAGDDPGVEDATPRARALAPLDAPARLFRAIALSRDGSRIAADCRDPSFQASVDMSQLIEGGPPHILTHGLDPVLLVWDAATGRMLDKIVAHRMPTDAIAFSPDGSRIAFGGPREYRSREREVQEFVRDVQTTPMAPVEVSKDRCGVVGFSQSRS
jgi:hypothetical protein